MDDIMDLTESDDDLDATRAVRKELGYEDYIHSKVPMPRLFYAEVECLFE